MAAADSLPRCMAGFRSILVVVILGVLPVSDGITTLEGLRNITLIAQRLGYPYRRGNEPGTLLNAMVSSHVSNDCCNTNH